MIMTKKLFRQQALNASVDQRFGRILLARPLSYTFLTTLFCLISFTLLLFFTCFNYTRKAQVNGQLQPTQGLIRVFPLQSGIIVAKKVNEGQLVRAGDILYELESQRSSASQGEVESTISELLSSRRESLKSDSLAVSQQARQRIAALQRRLDDLAADILRIDGQITLQQRRVKLAEQSVSRFQTLLDSHFVAPAALQDKQAELLDQQERLSELQRARASSERDRNSTAADLADQQIQAKRDFAAAGRNVTSIEQDLAENEARRRILVRAPQAGTLSAITASVGQTVTVTQTLASIVPQGSPLEAELYAPSQAAGFIKPGMTVQLRYQAYPYQKFGQFKGTVQEVSSSALNPDELSSSGARLSSSNNPEPVYRVRVRLEQQSVQAYGRSHLLKAGMLLDASIQLETRRLYEWILDPLYSVGGKV